MKETLTSSMLFPETRIISEPFVLSIQGETHPNEDRFFCESPVFVVTDGVSRTKPENGVYPDPSGAAEAAKVVADEAGKFLQSQSLYSPEALVEALRRGNDAVLDLNVRDGVVPTGKLDYLVYDYYSTCAAAVVVKDNILHWAVIGDTQVAVFDITDIQKFKTVDRVKELEKYREGLEFPSKEKKLKFWREFLRNKPEADYQTYGTLTGEWQAMSYVETYDAKKPRLLSRGDLVVVFSDGLYEHVMNAGFRKLLRKHPSQEEVVDFILAYREQHRKSHNGNDLPNGHDDKTLISFTV